MIYVKRMNFDSAYENITGTTYPYTTVMSTDHLRSLGTSICLLGI